MENSTQHEDCTLGQILPGLRQAKGHYFNRRAGGKENEMDIFDESIEITKECVEGQIANTEELENWHWPYQRINSGGDKEYACPHGAGHGGIHGCDGCCSHPSYLRRSRAKKKKASGFEKNMESRIKELERELDENRQCCERRKALEADRDKWKLLADRFAAACKNYFSHNDLVDVLAAYDAALKDAP